MGAINSAFNQALGAVAGAGIAIKHAKESDFSKMNTTEHAALVAKNQAVEAEAAANEAEIGAEQTNKDWINNVLDSWTKEEEYNKAKQNYDAKVKNASFENVQKKLTEWEASKRAIAELSNKINGIDAMRQRALDQRAYADRASQIASKAQQKYQSRWGGK